MRLRMRRVRLTGRAFRTPLFAVPLGLVAIGTTLAASGAAANAAPSTGLGPSISAQPPISTAGGVVTRSAHVPFEGCSARDITLRVSIAKDPFPIGQPVTYAVRITNSGTTACGPSRHGVPPLRHALTISPCGVLPGVISNHAGLDVYPGKLVFFCPQYLGVHLGAHATIGGEGTWNGYEALSDGLQSHGTVQWQQAPPGRYHVIVDNAVSVPFQLAARPATPTIPPGLTSPAHPGSPIIPPRPLTPPGSYLPTPTTPTTPNPKLPTPTTPTTTVG